MKQEMAEGGSSREDVTMEDGDGDGGTKEAAEKESVGRSQGQKGTTSEG